METETFTIEDITRVGYIFDGWYADEELTSAYSFGNMPAQNLTLYAKWIEKQSITINLSAQQKEVDSKMSFVIESELKGFVVEYFVNNKWVSSAPTEIGSYDVRIYRAEDATYSEFLQVIDNGLVVIQKTLNINWLIILLFALFVAEIVTFFIIKHLQKNKKIMPAIYSVALPFGLIPKNQFILAVVAGVLVLAMFVLIIYELVKLHKIVPMIDDRPSIYDTRNTIDNMTDKSEDPMISSKVDQILSQEGFKQIPKQDFEQPAVEDSNDNQQQTDDQTNNEEDYNKENIE